MTAATVRRALRLHASPARAVATARFFKSGKGEYGEGDRFIGLTVPQQRIIARSFRTLPLAQIDVLLGSPIHEERLPVSERRRWIAVRRQASRLLGVDGS